MPLDFFLWGRLNNEVYRNISLSLPTTLEDMHERIWRVCIAITPEFLENVKQSFIYRIRRCMEVTVFIFNTLKKRYIFVL